MKGAALAHDLGNLLAVIGAAAEAMGALPGAAEGERRAILDAVARGRAQLRALHGEAEPPERLDLAAWLARAAPLLRRLLGPGVALELRAPAGPLEVLAAPQALDRAVLNLAGNARRATGGQGRFVLSLRREGGRAVLEAADDGPGFSAAALARGLEAGFSGAGGTGMGLAVVRAAAAAAGGQVALGRAALGGALVRLELPLAPVAAARAAWVVEDEPGIRRAVEAVLARAGHAVRGFEDAEAALEALRAGPPPGLLVTDLTLPGLDGAALARAVAGTIPVLLMSGYGLEAAAGATHFLRKPFTSEELEAAISHTLSLAKGA
ncbi:ATP-binding protein [Roseococcus sp. DSY-14]|uniref:ATP-binding response regulator n=1 Tax=Roseococcus sp. DSY-14 TaxID=3369650 RepID=UPI00387AE414